MGMFIQWGHSFMGSASAMFLGVMMLSCAFDPPWSGSLFHTSSLMVLGCYCYHWYEGSEPDPTTFIGCETNYHYWSTPTLLLLARANTVTAWHNSQYQWNILTASVAAQ